MNHLLHLIKQPPFSTAIALTVVSLTFLGLPGAGWADSSIGLTNRALHSEVIAQSVPPSAITRDVWKQVYQKLPDLPRENKYVSRETGKVNPDNTLVNRLIQYHLYVKGRSPNYRLDWKLTLADYLGANELIQEGTYPGANTLRSNPLEGDRASINRLTRKQRDALVQSLESIFNPNSSNAATDTQTPPQPSSAPNAQTTPSFPQPKPGDAQLLQP